MMLKRLPEKVLKLACGVWLLVACAGSAQTTAPSAAPQSSEPGAAPQTSTSARITRKVPPESPYILKVESRQTVVDVVVTNKKGPVKGLVKQDFAVSENGVPQKTNYFVEHNDIPEVAHMPAPLPPGVYSNRPTVPASNTLNVLLIDGLNTSARNQPYIRSQMLKYLRGMPPGTRIAIFALGEQLHYIQGFTADPRLLAEALKSKNHNFLGLNDRATPGLNMPDTYSDASQDAQLNTDSALSSLQDFEAEATRLIQDARNIQRSEITVEAFQEIAAYLSNFPGRKNLIWFSDNFPMIIGSQFTADLQPGVLASGGQYELREMTNMYKEAQISIYPIDAGGLQPPVAFSAMQRGVPNVGASMRAQSGADAAKHDQMNDMADDTGGKAFYNTNDLAQAVAKVVDAGTFYYTIGYAPPPGPADGKFRKINVTLDRKGLTVTYRKGYFSKSPDLPVTEASAAADANAAQKNPFFVTMRRGAPDATGILFKVKFAPSVTQRDPAKDDDHAGDEIDKLKGETVRYRIDWAVDMHGVQTSVGDDGTRAADLTFAAVAFDADGNPQNSITRQLALKLTPAQFAADVGHGFAFATQLDLPESELFLRVAVYDPNGNKVGATEIPLVVKPLAARPASGAKD